MKKIYDFFFLIYLPVTCSWQYCGLELPADASPMLSNFQCRDLAVNKNEKAIRTDNPVHLGNIKRYYITSMK